MKYRYSNQLSKMNRGPCRQYCWRNMLNFKKSKESSKSLDFSLWPGEPGHPESVPGHHSEGQGQHQPRRHELARVGEPENMSYFSTELVSAPDNYFLI